MPTFYLLKNALVRQRSDSYNYGNPYKLGCIQLSNVISLAQSSMIKGEIQSEFRLHHKKDNQLDETKQTFETFV